MKILYICIGKLDINNWSGTTFNIYNELKKRNDVDVLELENESVFISKFYSIYNMILKKTVNKTINYQRSKIVLRKYAKHIEKIIKTSDFKYDAIFSIGTLPITFLDTDIPIYIYIDATVKAMENYYDSFSNIKPSFLKRMNMCESKALQKTKLVFNASEWVKKSVINDYQIDENKNVEVKIGANFNINLEEDEATKIIESRLRTEKISLLFVGIDWKRKGGDKFIQIGEEIKKLGHSVKLIIIGGNEKIYTDIEYENYGFLDKKNNEDLKKLMEKYSNTTFFVLPTKAECVGAVFCEAAAFGVPVISCKTGGIPSLVEDKKTGKLFNVNEEAKVIAQYIVETFKNKQKYKNMCWNSYMRYKKVLNWDVIVKNMEKNMNNK